MPKLLINLFFLILQGMGVLTAKKMHQSVWSDQRVLQRLAEEYIIISLYVDERTALPIDEQYVSDFGGKQRKIKSVGANGVIFKHVIMALTHSPITSCSTMMK